MCAQCQKANRECIPSSGITFRHQQNPSLNGSELGEGGLKSFYGYKETFGKSTVWVDVPRDLTFVHTNNPYEDEEDGPGGGGYAGDGDTSFMTDPGGRNEEPRSGVEYELAQVAYPAYATHGLEALSAVASQDQYSYTPPPAPMGQHEQISPDQQQHATSPQQSHAPTSQNLDFILNHSAAADAMSPNNIDPRLHSETPHSASGQHQSPIVEHVRTHSYSSSYGRPSLRAKGPHDQLQQQQRPPCSDRRAPIEDPELAFLLRDFSERGGLWMDLFDLNLFFATTVPVLAVRCPLLLYSCVALSAKCLARVDSRKPVMGGQVTAARQSKMEKWPGPPMSAQGWVHRAREYYDLAVSLLRQALAGASRPPTSSLPEDATPGTISAVQGYPLPTTDSDELVAATANLCVYEFLDASGPEWSRHLDGAKSLFDIASDRMVPLTFPPTPISVAQQATHRLSGSLDYGSEMPRQGLSKGRRAVFWCFARQDMLSAFINITSTRLETSDLAMWRSAGLKLTSEGFVCPSKPQHPDYKPENAMEDDLICNAFIWLLDKLVNFIAEGDDVPDSISPLGLGVRQRELLEYWESIDAQLKAWYDGLPDSFQATAVSQPESEMLGIEEKWYPRRMCASTMQWWHFARIQLLHNKPHLTTATPSARSHLPLGLASGGTSLASRHASYASILQQSREHAKEIVAIHLGRSDEGVRIHGLQPLWTAGLVLGGSEDRQVNDETEMWRWSILRQLRGIERDMGWATDDRVRSLLELWRLSNDYGVEVPD